MSIAIGVYDFFSYTIPGVFYLYVIYEFLKLFKINMFDFLSAAAGTNTPIQVTFLIVGLVAAFIGGQLFDMLAHWLVFSLMHRGKTSEIVLNKLKQRDTDANIQFVAKDWHLLLILLRQRNLSVAQSFDKHEADSIMFRNISLIALLMVFIMGAKALLGDPYLWFVVVAFLPVWIMAARRSFLLHTWFFEGVFLSNLEYGNSVSKVLEYDQRQYSEHIVRVGLLQKNNKEVR